MRTEALAALTKRCEEGLWENDDLRFMESGLFRVGEMVWEAALKCNLWRDQGEVVYFKDKLFKTTTVFLFDDLYFLSFLVHVYFKEVVVSCT